MKTPTTLNLTEEAKLFLNNPDDESLSEWKEDIVTSSDGFWYALTQGYFKTEAICTNPEGTLTKEDLLYIECEFFNNEALNPWA